MPADVKSIQNIAKGVPDMWSRAMLANKTIERAVTDRDRPILGYLQDIKLELHSEDYGFTLTFEFEDNQYFNGNILTKKYVMSKPNVIEKCVGTEIQWKNPSCDPTHMKKTKKKNKKKITVNQKVKSFFDLFQTIDMEDDKNKEGEDSEGEDAAERMDEDLDMGTEIKDNVIPLILELYLGIVELGDSDDDDEDGDEDEEEMMAKAQKAMGKAGKGKKGKEDCKQQ